MRLEIFIQTPWGSFPVTLSESAPYSDSDSLCAHGSVPITTLFGLSAALCPRFCPYYHSIRTQNRSVPAVLSLLHLYSDSARLCARGSVPITTLFGLRMRSVPAVLSLLPLFSDSARLCARGSVPITTLFGLSIGSVPAVLSLLPLFSDSARFCARGSVPITPLFGLSIGSAPAVLSVLPLYSDSARLCARGSVPITPLFGLSIGSVPAVLSLLPPLFGLSPALYPQVLSESEPYLDSVELFSLKHCLNQTNLLNKRLFSWIFHSQVLFTFFKRDINGHFGSIIIAIRIGAVRRITFRVIFIIFIVVDK